MSLMIVNRNIFPFSIFSEQKSFEFVFFFSFFSDLRLIFAIEKET